jgi:RHS repeat-associated protein
VVTARYVYGEAVGPSAEVDAGGTVVTRFVYGTHMNVPDAMVRAGKTYRFVLDSRGSVRLVVDAATGAIAQELDYDAFGVVTHDSNPGFQPFGFAGGLYDPVTGLVRFGARDYDASVGRFIAKDPLGFDGGSPNLYTYANDDPVSFTDPSGQFIPLAIAAAVVGGGLVNAALEGVRASLAGCPLGSVLGAAGRGFVSGAVGTAVGIGVGSIPGIGPVLAGMAAGAAGELTNQAMTGEFDATNLAVATAAGGLAFGDHLVPMRGYKPDLWAPRGPGTSRTYGPNSMRYLGQNAIDNAVANTANSLAKNGINQLKGCPTNACS